MEEKMSLAQVVHRMSTDRDFAAQWKLDPESALAQRGFRLSKEELDFLKVGLKRRDPEVDLSDIVKKAENWR
jgi:hypothetical protein